MMGSTKSELAGSERQAADRKAESSQRPGSDARKDPESVSRQSRVGLNAANFFLAEITGVVMPFLGSYLKGTKWSETAIGVAISLAGLGVFLMQTPAGMIVDRVRQRRTLLAGASILLGVCYGLLPLVPARPGWIDPLLFVAGMGQAFFLPLLGALALGLVGHAALNRTMGSNQGWNHAGNLAAALLAMGLVSLFGVSSVFLCGAASSRSWRPASVFLIREDEIDEDPRQRRCRRRRKRRQFANAAPGPAGVGALGGDGPVPPGQRPVMPFLGAYIKTLRGSDVQVAAVVLVAQAVMIPVALAAGWLCDRWGRKWVFGIGFVALPVRIFLYSLTQDPWTLVALQALDGIGAGIYGVVIVAICADLTKGKGGFNALSGMIATALAIGGVIGPLGAGFLAQHLGYNGFFYVFAGIAVAAAVLFLTLMPETSGNGNTRLGTRRERDVNDRITWLTWIIFVADLRRSGVGQGAGPAHGPGRHRARRRDAHAGHGRAESESSGQPRFDRLQDAVPAVRHDDRRRRAAAVGLFRAAGRRGVAPHHHAEGSAGRDDWPVGRAVGVPDQRRGLRGADAARVAPGTADEVRSDSAPDRPGDGGQRRLDRHDHRQSAEHLHRSAFGHFVPPLRRPPVAGRAAGAGASLISSSAWSIGAA